MQHSSIFFENLSESLRKWIALSYKLHVELHQMPIAEIVQSSSFLLAKAKAFGLFFEK